ncbi:MAG TPA: cbb3-type cytochrome c oxidase subunit I [Rhodanobacteraceae bacterium]|nr:cbb3-type cytochrome c oxidase subunit I [Rhodanobacteraceae bacterium]
MAIQYQTQRLSLRFFVLMLVLFVLQVTAGLILAAQEADPTLLAGVLNFNVVRAEHLNLAIEWILAGFMGAIFFVGPILSKRELAAPWLIKVLFLAYTAAVVWNVLTLGLAMKGIGGWWMDQPWLQQGLEYLEAGRATQVAVLCVLGTFAYIILKTFPPIREWNEIHWGIGLGVVALTLVYVFGMFFVARLDLQEYFRWFVVHYWVEGVWEIIHISLVGMLLVLLFKVDVKSVGYAVFWGVALVWLSGLLGNAHHYFWVGTPAFWQFWGSLFSAFEPLPLVFCFWHVYMDAHQNRKPLENAPAFYFVLGSVVLEQVGAGILGFSMTFALTNAWSHGTWITASHAHLALFGTFGMLVLGVAYHAVPAVRGLKAFDQRVGRLAFWLALIGMMGLALSFALGGTIEVYVYRTLGLHWFGSELFPSMGVYRLLLMVFGLVFAVGAGLAAFDLITMGHRTVSATATPALPPRGATGWRRPLTGFEAGTWLVGMWVFGGIITLGLLSDNLARVRIDGDATLPYLLAGIGYPGLLLVTLLFLWRFLASMEARVATAGAVPSGNLVQPAEARA